MVEVSEIDEWHHGSVMASAAQRLLRAVNASSLPKNSERWVVVTEPHGVYAIAGDWRHELLHRHCVLWRWRLKTQKDVGPLAVPPNSLHKVA